MGYQKKLRVTAARRLNRVRSRIDSTTKCTHRLLVHRSNKQIYAQIVDRVSGSTLCSVCSLGSLDRGDNIPAAVTVGQKIAEAALQKGITTVVFDRGLNRYHGRIAALADAARERGLKF